MERAVSKKIMIALMVFCLVTVSIAEDPAVAIPSAAGAQPKPEAKSQQTVQPKIGEPAHTETAQQKKPEQSVKPHSQTAAQSSKPSATAQHTPQPPASSQHLPQPTVTLQQQPQQHHEQQTQQSLQILAQQPTTLSQQQLLAQNAGENVDFVIDPLQENVIQTEEKQFQKGQIQLLNDKLKPWVEEEFNHIAETDSILTHQIFSFQLDRQLQFKWNPTQVKSGPLKFVVEVFLMNRGDVIYPQNPQQDDYVEVLTQSQTSTSFSSLGKVYIKRMFTINFFSDFQILKLRNNWPKQILIQISLQATKFIPEKALDDDSLQIPAKKIKTILQQLQQTEMKRQKTFRSEWGFHDRQQHHQSQMLILTGVELVIILGTAIVQIYCIKNLFDNRLVV